MNEERDCILPKIKDPVDANYANNDTEDNESDVLDWNQLSRKSSSAESGLADSDDLGISLDKVASSNNKMIFECIDENFDALELCSTISGSEFRSDDPGSDSDEDNFCMDYDDMRRCDTITEEDDDDEENMTNACSAVNDEGETNDELGSWGKGLGNQVSLQKDDKASLSLDPNSFSIIEETPHIAKKIETCRLNLEESLQLREIDLTLIPEALMQLKHLQNLYLNNNQIAFLPTSFFPSLPQLKWLDLRHNQLDTLPSNVGEHSNLTTLLLEGNRLTTLPPELGLTAKLRGLNIRNNPLIDPPDSILNSGLQGILHYLRQKVNLFNERADENDDSERKMRNPISVIKSKPRKKNKIEDFKKRRRLIPYELGADYYGISSEILATKAHDDEARLSLRLRQDQINTVLQHIKSEVALKTWRHKARIEQMEAAESGECSKLLSHCLFREYYMFYGRDCWIQLQNNDLGKTSKQYPLPMPGYIDAARRKKERLLERQIWAHLEKLQESAQNGSVDIEEAAGQLAEIERLQKELTAIFRTLL